MQNSENTGEYDPIGQIVSSVGSDGVDSADNSGDFMGMNPEGDEGIGAPTASMSDRTPGLETESASDSVFDSENPQTSFPGSPSPAEISPSISSEPPLSVFTGMNSGDGLL